MDKTVIVVLICAQELSIGNQQALESWNPMHQHTMGQRVGLSFFDSKLANLAYCKRELYSLPLCPFGNVLCREEMKERHGESAE